VNEPTSLLLLLTLAVVEGEQVPLKQIYVEDMNNKMTCKVLEAV
jgi:hypothetical protein